VLAFNAISRQFLDLDLPRFLRSKLNESLEFGEKFGHGASGAAIGRYHFRQVVVIENTFDTKVPHNFE